MRLWRIATNKSALDKRCQGTRTEGGRWNPIGMAALYAGTTPVICALEKFVHLSGIKPPPLKLVAIDVPDTSNLAYTPAIADLPPDWADLPMSAGAQEFGRRWLEAATHLIMLVPSVIVPEALNAVINPLHPEYTNVRLQIVRDFTFDARMFK